MKNREKTVEQEYGRILDKGLFVYLLDHELKRARRYQNFLCLLLLKLQQRSNRANGNFHTCYEELGHLLEEEMRESDLLGELDGNQLVALLPYADESAGGLVRSRLEEILRDYDFQKMGYEVLIRQICFPVNGSSIVDILKKIEVK